MLMNLSKNLSNFKNSLHDINWHQVVINDDADEAYDLFNVYITFYF